MLPKTHVFVIRAAVAASGNAWLVAHEPHLLRGHRAEDDFVLFGMHFRAPGLTHSYEPGSRFGELGAPSAKTQIQRWLRRAQVSLHDSERAFWLGRACHLLGDLAVPARTRRIWHLLGDPLEAYWEEHEDLARLLGTALPATDGNLETLASFSSGFAVDTTRSPWSRGSGKALDNAEVAQQAGILLPVAVAYTRDWLRHGLDASRG